ncbi:MAG TPA: DUF2073 domain-containing protein [Candidatus Woesearchaeota archaeon]|nr:DUF2073 domain-containing protein [Candidatus Woesearchaeota archaeon]
MITIEFIPFSQMSGLSTEQKIKKILKSVKSDKIVLLQGKLKKDEETELIKLTMSMVNEKFHGIEPAIFSPEIKNTGNFLKFLKEKFINMLLSDRQGITLVGPANLIKEIKRDPEKMQLLLDLNVSRRKKK